MTASYTHLEVVLDPCAGCLEAGVVAHDCVIHRVHTVHAPGRHVLDRGHLHGRNTGCRAKGCRRGLQREQEGFRVGVLKEEFRL